MSALAVVVFGSAVTITTIASAMPAPAGNQNVINQKHWSGLTFGQMAEKFFAAYVFPPRMEITYKGVTAGINRDNVICERFESNGSKDIKKKGYWITCRARYSGFVRVGVVKFPVGAERARVYYDNGKIRVDLGGLKGAFNTKSIGKWVKTNF